MITNPFKSDTLFTGYYGQFNTGDDAFVEVASWGGRKYWHSKNNRFLAKKNNLPITTTETSGYPFSIPKTYNAQKRLLLSSTKRLVSAGGSTIHSSLGKSNIKKIAINRKAAGQDLKVGAIGVSIGPFNRLEDEKSVIDYLKHIDFLAVRDQASYDFASSLQLPYEPINAFDLAALLPEIYGINKSSFNTTKKTIGISVCPVESINSQHNIYYEHRRNEKTVQLIKQLDQSEEINFKFFVINGHPIVGDLKLTNEIINLANPKSFEIVHYQKNTKVMWEQVSSCDFVISTRLHAAIFACFSNTPFMLNEYHKKCSDFLETIKFEDRLRLYNSEYDAKKQSALILDLINNNNYPSLTNNEHLTDKARLNFTGVKL